nr:hypothetical protein [Tanacetum cinerariifolium]
MSEPSPHGMLSLESRCCVSISGTHLTCHYWRPLVNGRSRLLNGQSSCHVSGRVATCHHLSRSTWHPRVTHVAADMAKGLIAKPGLSLPRTHDLEHHILMLIGLYLRPFTMATFEKFASKYGMDQVLEKGPWLIRKSPIILNKWAPSVSLKKGEVANVPVWVKMYNVPVLAYSEDGLSLIATQIGKLIMLDAFTSSMCVESWGRISFARALIEVSASSALKKEIIMAVPEDEGDGYVKEVIRIEYEWKPPHCVDCQSFGHDSKLCPKRIREEVPNNSTRVTKATIIEENDDGFTEVKSRKKKKGVDFGGIRLNKPNITTGGHRPPAIAAVTTADHLLSSSLPLSFSWDRRVSKMHFVNFAY